MSFRFYSVLRTVLILLLLCATSRAISGVPSISSLWTDDTPVTAELIASAQSIQPGTPLWLGLRLNHAPGWHTYWQNPGDAGLPTRLKWQLPPFIQVGQIEWIIPQRLPIFPLVDYGYEGDILLPVLLGPIPKNQAELPRNIEIKVRADWLMCKTTCIPSGADLRLTLPISPAIPLPSQHAMRFQTALANVPTPSQGETQVLAKKGFLEITLSGMPLAKTSSDTPYLYPVTTGLIQYPAQQFVEENRTSANTSNIIITIPIAQHPDTKQKYLQGVFTGWGHRAFSFTAPIQGLPLSPGAKVPFDPELTALLDASKKINDKSPNDPLLAPSVSLTGIENKSSVITAPNNSGTESSVPLPLGISLKQLLLYLFSAFIGGMILNLMPCVFPVISLKILSFQQPREGYGHKLRLSGWAYTLGVILSFLLLAGILLLVRSLGIAIGWGFQLQSPAVVSGLALLFFAMGLNLSGVFEWGNVLPQSVLNVSAKNPLLDSFLSGVLAVLVASPCTAPFMGAVIGIALIQDNTFLTLALFITIGAGLAAPYLLLAYFPQLLKRTPKPGPWLQFVRPLFAFLLYASFIWLLWVLVQQVGPFGIVSLGISTLLLAFALWAWQFPHKRLRYAAVASFIALLFNLFSPGGMMSPFTDTSAPASHTNSPAPELESKTSLDKPLSAGEWHSWSPEVFVQARTTGKPVFVDFTAAWCITCQVNEVLVLETTEINKAWMDKDVILLRADWTRYDPRITQALAEVGRSGVPTYALYTAGSQTPLLFPELLTKKMILDALESIK